MLTTKGDPLPLRQRTWEVVVAGAGPAGTMSALSLARAGFSVLLVDRSTFPRAKVCGCCLNMAAVEVLQDAGLFPILKRLGARPLNELRIHFRNRQIPIRLPGGYAVSRAALDEALVEAAREEGVHFLTGVRAGLEELRANSCSITLIGRSSSQTVRACTALCADGLNGSFLAKNPEFAPKIYSSSRIGISSLLPDQSADLPSGSIEMSIGSKGYVGMVELEDGRINVAAAIASDAIVQADKTPSRAVRGILEEAGAQVPLNMSHADWRGTPPLTRRRRVVGDRRLLILGDAAGYVEPFTGEGIAWALASGRLIVPVVQRFATSQSADLGREWQQLHSKSIRRRQRTCRVVQTFLKRPGLTSALLRCFAPTSSWIHPIVSLLNRPLLKEASIYEF